MSISFPLSVAPMMEWTDRHYRFMMRLITKKTILYSEMVTAEAILRGDTDKLLAKNDDSPVILQLGGDNPDKILRASRYAKEYGYDGVNLNVGCPSDRVQNGNFGACLMKTPELVSELMIAMREGSSLPISIKHRIGIDGKESYQDLANFVQIISSKSKVSHFIIHARIAILGGLSPAENRSIPPLRYEDVFQVKRDFPDLRIEINGGIKTLADAKLIIKNGVDAVMIGRAAYENPSIFFEADHFPTELNMIEDFPPDTISNQPNIDWNAFMDELEIYCKEWIEQGGKIHHVLRHSLGLFHGKPGGKKFRRYLSESMYKEPKGYDLFRRAYLATISL
jgi:tRNA-dihydrouridine synthase A